ncbi:M20/M25/M40 family metallo-hydrolase [Parasphingopyxis sp. CP4]|uniref:M20/M25/M40 family metallo-hydrolase n=1 Tax=Parasphingopyxis sp. CP4 TaxID=2724527 RepID=UPI0015A416E1|nr:M20/M25/M40 family metallo-hydrolase [Parasphingopyxis sp. CP4]QLC23038.1 M20/M25/M40 family metallo-hydrolase [Parasphingopyxis sp. CP4]
MTTLVSDLMDDIRRRFDEDAIPSLSEFIRIQNVSPAFDPKGESAPNTRAALKHVSDWAITHAPDGTSIDTLEIIENSPILVIDIPGTTDTTVMCYGHLDKHPSDSEWSEGTSGYEPVLRNGKLFGRGGVDGGFAPYCYVTAMATLAQHELKRPRCILFLETTEKSASMYLPRYLPEVRKRFDEPSLIVLLESICADYDRLWYMQGYRGVVEGTLSVNALAQPAHSGAAGLAPTAIGIAFDLLSRVCNLSTGLVTLDTLQAKSLGHITTGGAETDAIAARYFLDAAQVDRTIPGITDDLTAAAPMAVHKAGLSIAEIHGLRSGGMVGGTLPDEVSVNIAVRLPPEFDGIEAAANLEEALVSDPPLNARVEFIPSNISPGWHSGPLPAWLQQSIDAASFDCFGNQAVGWRIGGAYLEIEILAQEFQATPILMTGIKGPKANFQSADESLDIAAAHKLTGAIARILSDSAEQPRA